MSSVSTTNISGTDNDFDRPSATEVSLYRLPGTSCLYVFSLLHVARRARPEGARKLSPGFTLGWCKNKRFALKGLESVRDPVQGFGYGFAVPGGPFRANSGGGNQPRVNPGLCSFGQFGPRIRNPNSRAFGSYARR
jgi:hypothetical protein